jgi:hypothetical protein
VTAERQEKEMNEEEGRWEGEQVVRWPIEQEIRAVSVRQ